MRIGLTKKVENFEIDLTFAKKIIKKTDGRGGLNVK